MKNHGGVILFIISISAPYLQERKCILIMLLREESKLLISCSPVLIKKNKEKAVAAKVLNATLFTNHM